MRPPCEIVVNKILPHIRADIVKILTKEYHMKQIEVSKRLGITQASVSQYLSSSRGGDKEFHKLFPEMEEHARTIAKRIATGDSKDAQVALICSMCSKMREEEKFCEYHKGYLDLESCGICFDEASSGQKKD
jgi:predicted transcriptional regulator